MCTGPEPDQDRRMPVLSRPVMALDRWLRRRYAIREYSDRSDCLFRYRIAAAAEPAALSDGTVLRPGDAVLELHFWNEHFPPFGPGGPDLAWARQVRRSLENSLRELAAFLARHPELDHLPALRGLVALGSAGQAAQLLRLCLRLGFEPVPAPAPGPLARLHRLGENMLIVLLVLALNRRALAPALLRRTRTLVYMPRSVLLRCYGAAPDGVPGAPG